MKKLVLLISLICASFASAQVVATPESKDLNEVYKGGDAQFKKDVENSFGVFSSDYQVNGKFILTFDLDKDGKIQHPKVFPETSDDFKFALIRSFKRVKNNFNPNMPTDKLSVMLDFSPIFKSDDGRERFTESTMTERFNARNN
ncbi:hypothetical protein [Halpernia frigidisoli]|uniref:TonB C-terminal domain-containing protein n=1 Tax=Halpernia frigidisoli TaxID=1125876 RepID=A0A1I3I1D3_9FLAO|nr:hypothetical protein [Halpernia frigidisoli]SFI41776.1 hypothetical protein SAMN05443292_2511 [Halpernia frigidisoli]